MADNGIEAGRFAFANLSLILNVVTPTGADWRAAAGWGLRGDCDSRGLSCPELFIEPPLMGRLNGYASLYAGESGLFEDLFSAVGIIFVAAPTSAAVLRGDEKKTSAELELGPAKDATWWRVRPRDSVATSGSETLRSVGNASMLCVCCTRMVRAVPYSYA